MKSNKTSKRHIEHVTCIKNTSGAGTAYISRIPEFTPGTAYISRIPEFTSGTAYISRIPEFTPGTAYISRIPEFTPGTSYIYTSVHAGDFVRCV